MKPRRKWMVAGGVVAVVGALGAGVAATAAPESDAPLTGETRDKAAAAAVEHVGGGTVTDTEIGDDGAAYGVEVLKPDGSQVEVHLDREYKVTGTEADDDGPGDHEGADDDHGPDDEDDGPDDDQGSQGD